MMRRASFFPVFLVVCAGCSSAPPRNLYSLSAPVDPAAGISNVTARPVIELQRVSMPDYLDTTDIVLRGGGNELKVSATGRWAERLSDGLNQALMADLVVRLPGDQITATPPSRRMQRQILVTVEAFDVEPDGRCILTAAWTILDKNNDAVLIAERGAFIAPVKDASGRVEDADIVSAMVIATGELADGIAAAVIKIPASVP
jgi:uncharacterized lipoprotein YmbA